MNYLKNTKKNKIYRIENDEPIEDTDIEHYIEVLFNDDSYVNGDDKNRICLVRISIVLKFEQITKYIVYLKSGQEYIHHLIK